MILSWLDYEEYEKTGLAMDELARKLCDRHFGVGADGMIIPNCELRADSLADPLNANNSNTNNADIGWYFYNSDGSTAANVRKRYEMFCKIRL